MRKYFYLLLISITSVFLFSSCVKGPDLFYEKETFLVDGKGGELYIPILTSEQIEEVKIKFGILEPWIEVLDYGKVEEKDDPSVTFAKPEKERYYIRLNVQPNEGSFVRRATLVSIVGEIYEVPVEIIQTVCKN